MNVRHSGWPVVATALLMAALSSSAFGQRQETEPRTEARAPGLSRWMIYMRAFGYDLSASPVLSVNRRIGPRSDVGLQLDADFNSDHEVDESSVYPTDGRDPKTVNDQDDFHVWLHAETRRWKFLSPKVSSWLGLRFSLGYGRADRDRDFRQVVDGIPEQVTAAYDRETLDAGLALTCGAEVELLRHVSAAAALVPLRYVHHWTKTVTDEERSTDYIFRRNEDWSRSYDIETSLTAAAYLVLRF